MAKTNLGDKNVVLTYGTFDLLHRGHINILKKAKKLGDYLIVGLSSDKFNELKNKKSFYNFYERKIILESLKYVDKVIPENNWNQKINDIKKYNVKTIVMGDDWKGKFDYLKKYCKVIYFRRTSDISTSLLKNNIKEFRK